MKYCKKCVMPDTRPYLKFDNEGVCYPCRRFEHRKEVDWKKRWIELEKLADKYRGSNGDYYDCIITVSGGKDSHFQTYIFKEKLNMNPLLVSIDNNTWTQTGRLNWDNLHNADAWFQVMGDTYCSSTKEMCACTTTLNYIVNTTTGAGFWLDSSIGYGDFLVVACLLLIVVILGSNLILSLEIPKRMNFKKN
jgi:hypothetical protein